MVLVTCIPKGLQPLLVVCFLFFFLQRAAQEPFVIFVFEKNYRIYSPISRAIFPTN